MFAIRNVPSLTLTLSLNPQRSHEMVVFSMWVRIFVIVFQVLSTKATALAAEGTWKHQVKNDTIWFISHTMTWFLQSVF